MQEDRSEAPVRTQVNLLLRDAAEVTRFLWRDLAETHGIVIDVVRDFGDVPQVTARPAALREAFVVLIVNAVHARAGGGVITLRTERRGDAVLASVIGAGPAAASSSGQRSPLAEGNHLAGPSGRMSAAERTAVELGGRLTIDSSSEQGTVYTLSLPVVDDEVDEGSKIVMASHPADILFIDNEPGVRDAFSRLLTLYGHRVATAESGEKGIAAFRASQFDLVFTDLGMPGMSGWDVAREIKKISSSALVVLVTGWPIDLNERKPQETGVDRVLTKPLDMTLVLSLIDDAVALKHGS
jgi:CheY-like chemotaxis protein